MERFIVLEAGKSRRYDTRYGNEDEREFEPTRRLRAFSLEWNTVKDAIFFAGTRAQLCVDL
jgi:hypothetical protein